MANFIHRFIDNYITFARQIDVTAFWFLIILFCVVALCAAWTFFHYARLRAAASVPFLPVDNTSPGYIDVTGAAMEHLLGPLVSPLTRTRCAWYRYKIWEYDTSEAKFKLIHYDGGMYQLLALRDDSGCGVVNMAGAEVKPSQHRWYYADERNASLDQMTLHYRQQRFCFEEELIEIGADVWISGSCHHVNASMEIGAADNEDRLIVRVIDEFGEDWVDEVMLDRWQDQLQQRQATLRQQWLAYNAKLSSDQRPILITDDGLMHDQAYVVSAMKPTIHRLQFLLMYWFFGLFTVCSLFVIASMLFLRAF